MSAGPAPYRMTSPLGPVWPAAAVPMAPKMPAPMTAPIASMTRSPAPNTRLRERASSPGGCSSEIGLRANRCGTDGTLNDEAHEIHEGHCISCSRSEEHTYELQSLRHLVCRRLLEKTK